MSLPLDAAVDVEGGAAMMVVKQVMISDCHIRQKVQSLDLPPLLMLVLLVLMSPHHNAGSSSSNPNNCCRSKSFSAYIMFEVSVSSDERQMFEAEKVKGDKLLPLDATYY
jgi:hypothetical protein